MTYIEKAREILVAKLAGVMGDGPLMDLYLTLVFTKGADTTLEDVHDAWAIAKSRTTPDHRSIIPFSELTVKVQELDREFVEAIAETAKELEGQGR